MQQDRETLIAGLVDLAEYQALCSHIDDIEKDLYEGLALTYDAKKLLRKTRFWQAFRQFAHVIKFAPSQIRNNIQLEMAKIDNREGYDPLIPFSRDFTEG